MGTEEPALTRRFRLTGQISMSGASQRYVHILVSHLCILTEISQFSLIMMYLPIFTIPYHLKTHQNSLLSEYGLCSVSLNNKLYLVGGQTTITDCYDPEQNEWRQMCAMKERRMECGSAVINGCIYVAGGYSYSKGTYLQSIERYDPEIDCWEIVGNLPSAARSHGCVCVFSV